MAKGLASFARRMAARADQVEDGTNDLIKKVVMRVEQVLVLQTPVDTGRARANWLVSANRPVTEPADDTDPSGSATIAKAQAVVSAAKPGDTLYISNNVPYIDALNRGHSAQAPAGFIEAGIDTAVATVKGAKVLK